MDPILSVVTEYFVIVEPFAANGAVHDTLTVPIPDSPLTARGAEGAALSWRFTPGRFEVVAEESPTRFVATTEATNTTSAGRFKIVHEDPVPDAVHVFTIGVARPTLTSVAVYPVIAVPPVEVDFVQAIFALVESAATLREIVTAPGAEGTEIAVTFHESPFVHSTRTCMAWVSTWIVPTNVYEVSTEDVLIASPRTEYAELI
jgi:hypothetical protein